MHTYDTLRSRLVARASLAAPVVAVMLVLMATAVSATPAPPKVHVKFEGARLQFTNCPPVFTGETFCLGGDVNESRQNKHVGAENVHSTEVDVGVAAIHITSTGQVEVGPVLGFGSLTRKVAINGLRDAQIHEDVPLNDGSTASVDVDLTGVGDELPFTSQVTMPEPLCPDGWVDLTLTRVYRAADPGTTTLTFHGIELQPTSFNFGPFLLQETDEGVCTGAPG